MNLTRKKISKIRRNIHEIVRMIGALRQIFKIRFSIKLEKPSLSAWGENDEIRVC